MANIMDTDNDESCDICMEQYDDEKVRPRSLPCGHTYCTTCLDNTIKSGALECPYCKKNHGASKATDFPINYTVERIVSKLKKAKQIPASSSTHSSQTEKGFSKWKSVLNDQKESLQNMLENGETINADLLSFQKYLLEKKKRHDDLLKQITDWATQHKDIVKEIEILEDKVASLIDKGCKSSHEAKHKLSHHKNVISIKDIVAAADDFEKSQEDLESWKMESQQLPNIKTIIASDKLTDNTVDALRVMNDKTHGVTKQSKISYDSSSTIMDKIAALNVGWLL